MYYNTKRFNLITKHSFFEYPPKIYLDWFILDPDPRRGFISKELSVGIGLWKLQWIITFRWKFVKEESEA